MPPGGSRRADEAGRNELRASKKSKHTHKPKERLHSYDRTPYHRRNGGDAPGRDRYRSPPNENAARSKDGYRRRRDEWYLQTPDL